jgi:hypothetical protein
MLPEDVLSSYQNLAAHIHTMTHSEVLAALKFESQTQRRKAVLCRLLRRAVRLNEINYKQELVRKYLDGKKEICGNG